MVTSESKRPAWIRSCNGCCRPLHVRKRTCDHCGAAQVSRRSIQEAATAKCAKERKEEVAEASLVLAYLSTPETGSPTSGSESDDATSPARLRRAASAGVAAAVARTQIRKVRSAGIAKTHAQKAHGQPPSEVRLRRLLKLRALLVAAPAAIGLSETARLALAELESPASSASATPLPSPTGGTAHFALLATVASLAAPEATSCASPEP